MSVHIKANKKRSDLTRITKVETCLLRPCRQNDCNGKQSKLGMYNFYPADSEAAERDNLIKVRILLLPSISGTASVCSELICMHLSCDLCLWGRGEEELECWEKTHNFGKALTDSFHMSEQQENQTHDI